jgi:hypothetical protein
VSSALGSFLLSVLSVSVPPTRSQSTSARPCTPAHLPPPPLAAASWLPFATAVCLWLPAPSILVVLVIVDVAAAAAAAAAAATGLAVYHLQLTYRLQRNKARPLTGWDQILSPSFSCFTAWPDVRLLSSSSLLFPSGQFQSQRPSPFSILPPLHVPPSLLLPTLCSFLLPTPTFIFPSAPHRPSRLRSSLHPPLTLLFTFSAVVIACLYCFIPLLLLSLSPISRVTLHPLLTAFAIITSPLFCSTHLSPPTSVALPTSTPEARHVQSYERISRGCWHKFPLYLYTQGLDMTL